MDSRPFSYPWWTRGDLDGFFGLMVDNLVQVLMITTLCTVVAGIPADFVSTRILPGVAVSLLIGNVFYGLQARSVARRDQNATCTALPYGINTPTVFAYILFIMGPVYRGAVAGGAPTEQAADMAWKAGLLACLVSGAIEFGAAFFAGPLRRITPRAALLGALAAIGITFIAGDFAFRIYTHPLVGLLPLMLVALAYFAEFRFPFHIPGGLLVIVVGAAGAWITSIPTIATSLGVIPLTDPANVTGAFKHIGFIVPTFCGNEIWSVIGSQDLLLRFLTISIPMGLMNALGSIQNIESAEAGGDRFAAGPSLAANGIGTLSAALFGSCFPTTIYIGHPGWKAMGARSGYSIANGLFYSLVFLLGFGQLLAALVPIEAGAAIILYIGILIAAQAFQTTPRAHAPAVALGFFPAIAAQIVVLLPQFMVDAGASRTLEQMLSAAGHGARVAILPGLVSLTGANSGWFILTLLLVATITSLTDRRYATAAGWMIATAVLTGLGLLHAYRVVGNDIRELFIWQPLEAGGGYVDRGFLVMTGYIAAALLFLMAHFVTRGRNADERITVEQ